MTTISLHIKSILQIAILTRFTIYDFSDMCLIFRIENSLTKNKPLDASIKINNSCNKVGTFHNHQSIERVKGMTNISIGRKCPNRQGRQNHSNKGIICQQIAFVWKENRFK